MKRVFGILAFCSFFLSIAIGQVQINEAMSRNLNVVIDEDGDYPDWIELHNSSNETVSLKDWTISDRDSEEHQFKLREASIAPKGYLLIWCSSKDKQLGNIVHTTFKLNEEGETVFLRNDNGALIDSLIIPSIQEDFSYGWMNDQKIVLSYFNKSSPGQSNSLGDPIVIPTLSFTDDPGVYDHSLDLSVLSTVPGFDIRYTTNGREPNEESPLLIDYIRFDPLSELTPYFSSFPSIEDYSPPLSINQYNHIRCKAYKEKQAIGPELIGTFIFDPNFFDIYNGTPVVLVDVAERSFFDKAQGIYVQGDNTNFKQTGIDSERPATVSFWDDFELISRNHVGIRIHGHATRDLPQKSLKLYARAEYGDTVIRGKHFNTFDQDQFDRLILRSFHSDIVKNEFTDFGFRDDVVMSIIGDQLNVYAQKQKIVIVYLNGEYWGLHSLREATDNNFISDKTGLPESEIELLAENTIWTTFYNDIKAIPYDDPLAELEISRHLDLDNFIDYLLCELFFFNRDWPHNNVKTWREVNASDPWKAILFDLDATLKNPKDNSLLRFYSEIYGQQFNSSQDVFFQKLFQFSFFRKALERRFAELRHTVFSPYNMVEKLQILKEELEPLIDSHNARWHYPVSKKIWLKSANEIEKFLTVRTLFFQEALASIASPLLIPNPTKGNLVLDLDLDNSTDIKVQCYSPEGKKIKEWIVNNNNKNIDASDLNSGPYLFKIWNRGVIKTEKIIILP